MTVCEKAADAEVNERLAARVCQIAPRIWHSLRVIGKQRIGRRSDVTGGEVGEQRFFTGTTVAVTFVASRLSAKKVITGLLLRRELRLFSHHGIELRRERRHLVRGLIPRNGLRHLIEGGRCAPAI